MNRFDWDHTFYVDFDLESGFSKKAETTKRYLSQMKNMFYDTEAAEKILEKEDPLIYEFYELGYDEREGDLAFGTTILYPGQVGGEYFMTKGHFHTILETAEVYYTLNGEGYMVMENPEGDTVEMPLVKGQALYVPRRYAHRTVNTGKDPLVMFFSFQAAGNGVLGMSAKLAVLLGNAGHDYGTIETKGYHKMIVERDGRPVVVPNPKW